MADRMSLAESLAERYAAELDRAGVLEAGDEKAAFEVLVNHMPFRRAEALVRDLRMYGALEKTDG